MEVENGPVRKTMFIHFPLQTGGELHFHVSSRESILTDWRFQDLPELGSPSQIVLSSTGLPGERRTCRYMVQLTFHGSFAMDLISFAVPIEIVLTVSSCEFRACSNFRSSRHRRRCSVFPFAPPHLGNGDVCSPPWKSWLSAPHHQRWALMGPHYSLARSLTWRSTSEPTPRREVRDEPLWSKQHAKERPPKAAHQSEEDWKRQDPSSPGVSIQIYHQVISSHSFLKAGDRYWCPKSRPSDIWRPPTKCFELSLVYFLLVSYQNNNMAK